MYFSFQHQYLFPSSLSNRKIRIFYVLYVHFVQSDNVTSKNLQHITKELHRFMGQTCTRTFAVHIKQEQRPFTNYMKQQKYKNILITGDGEFCEYFSQNKFNFDDVNSSVTRAF